MSDSISSDQVESVARSIERDKENLFSLADKIIDAAPHRQWGIWLADATSSYFLVQFMRDVFSASNKVDGDPPKTIHIANSRSVRSHPSHQRAVMARLSQPELAIAGRNALILSEYTKDRVALSTLSAPLRRAGALAVDAAVLNLDYPGLYIRPTDKPDVILRGEPWVYEPEMFLGILKNAVGQASVLGQAEPLDSADANLELREYVSVAFEALAQEYTIQRQS